MIKQLYKFIKKNNIVCYVLLLLTYVLLVSYHAKIVDYVKIRFAQDFVTFREVSVEGVKKISTQISQSSKSNYINFEFDFKLRDEASTKNLFQTAAGNKGIRLELLSTSAGMVIPDLSSQGKTVTFEINKKIIPNEWHHINAEALQKEFIIISIDKNLVINTREYKPQFDVSEITFGNELSDKKFFHVEIKNVNLTVKNVQQVWWFDILLTIISVFLLVVSLFLIYYSEEEAITENLSPSGADAYLRALYFIYIVYLGLLFVTNCFSNKELSYWPIIFIVIAPFKWKLVSFYDISVPVPEGLSLSEVKRNIHCVRTPTMAALFVYIANKAVVSWLLPSNQPPLDYFITEYFFGLVLFFLGFMRLATDLDNFLSYLFLWLSPLVAINGLINIYITPFELSRLLIFSGNRLSPSFGPGVDVGAATSAALTYALYFYGLLITLINKSIDQKSWRIKSLGFVPFIFILIFSLYLTHTRGAALGLLITCCLSLVIVSRHRGDLLLKNKNVTLAIFGLVLPFIPLLIKYFFERDDVFRFEVWRRSQDLMREYFLFGSGDRGFGRNENSGNLLIGIILSNGVNIPHAHNILFNALIRGGFIGVISLVAYYFFLARKMLRFTLTRRELIPPGTLIIFSVAGLFDFDLHIYPGAWMITSNWVPLLVAAATHAFDKDKNKDRVGKVRVSQISAC